MQNCPKENFNQLAESISRIEKYIGLKYSNDINTISGQIKGISTYIAGESIDIYTFVYMNSEGRLNILSNADRINCDSLIGITLTSGILDDLIIVQHIGRIYNSDWNLDKNKLIFIGIDGKLTQECPLTGVLIRVGNVLSSDEILINISEPIHL